MRKFGTYVREKRERFRMQRGANFSVRQVAQRIGVEPSYLSRIERCIEGPPSEEKIIALARELSEDPDVLLARAGKISRDLQRAVCSRPKLFARMIRDPKEIPDHVVLKLMKEVCNDLPIAAGGEAR